jgi:hypothetical protein
MTDEIIFSTLQRQFKQIKELYSSENYKYIHVKTIDNLLSNADSFFMKSQKEEIYKTLSEYFDIIGSKQIDNVTESLELFNKYIRPLTILYSDLKDFHIAPRPWIIVLWILFSFFMLFFLKASFYFYVSLTALIVLLLSRQIYFIRQKKTYGFMH